LTHLDRVLAMLGLLLVFTLDEIHLAHDRSQTIDPARGFVHPTVLTVAGSTSTAYLSTPDLALRWGLALLVAAAGLWVLAHTLKPEAAPARARSGRNRQGPFGT
jgi:hypothetical protein